MTVHRLELRDVSVRYGAAVAVDHVALEATGGAVTALVGANGAGKSSTLLAAYGSVRARGQVLLDGDELSAYPPIRRAKAGLAIVPQGRQLFARLTVLENLQVMADTLGLPRGRVDDGLDRFPRLRERAKVLAGVLSGGEQQMLVVARALMSSPVALLMDEMTTGLAPLVVRELLSLLGQLSESGVAVLLAEPSLAAMRQHVDRGYVLVRGQVAAQRDSGAALDEAYRQQLGLTETGA